MPLDFDLKSFLPNFAIVNRAKDSDPKMAWALCAPIRSGEIVVFDKVYVDFEHLNHLSRQGVIWVTRAKDNMYFEVVGQQPIVLSDCKIRLAKETTCEMEVFFKEIKQTLQLADFLGTSENTIQWQIWIALLSYLLLRLVAWLGEWKRSFRRIYTLVKGMLWSQRSLSSLMKSIEAEEGGTSPPIKLSAVQMQFDFGDI